MNLRQLAARWRRKLFRPAPLGRRGEAAAAKFLRRRGHKILARGYQFGPGELDLVTLDRETIVFVEVKTRRSAELGEPSEAVDFRKQRKLTLLAVSFLKRYGLLNRTARFDVVSVIWPEGKWRPRIEHIPNAFEAVGHWVS